jgi:OOP family OmpA-OmpF porin
MKFKLTILFWLITMMTFAQDAHNKWSFEFGGGFNKAMAPLTPGYLTPTLNLGHVSGGTRYMLNDKFGLRTDIAIGRFRELAGTPEFNTDYGRLTFEAVTNLSRIFNMESFTNRFGIHMHNGIGVTVMEYRNSRFDLTQPDVAYSFINGLAGLYKINERIALSGDISIIVNGRQTYSLDGNDYNNAPPTLPESNPFVHATGTWWTGSLGLIFYLGKNDQHLDWYIPSEKYATKVELSQQFGEIRDMLKDSDGDGIPDYLDKEPNTPTGARVDNQGRTLDSDGDGIPDHLDKCPFVPGPSSNDGCPLEEVKEIDYFKKAINEGYQNVFFAFDSAKPLAFSITGVDYVVNFLKRNPGVNLEIKGYADEIGPEDYNLKLSEKRALSVKKILIDSGIDALRLSVKGYGEDTSVDKESSEARQLARRVSFEVL